MTETAPETASINLKLRKAHVPDAAGRVAIFEPGSTVRNGDDSPDMVVTVAMVGLDSVQYRCQWWDNASRHSADFAPWELRQVGSQKRLQVGFLATAEIQT